MFDAFQYIGVFLDLLGAFLTGSKSFKVQAVGWWTWLFAITFLAIWALHYHNWGVAVWQIGYYVTIGIGVYKWTKKLFST